MMKIVLYQEFFILTEIDNERWRKPIFSINNIFKWHFDWDTTHDMTQDGTKPGSFLNL